MFKSQQIILLFTVIILSVTIQANAQCGKNQEYTDCGSSCPLKCNDNSLQICSLKCIVGCQCKPGYFLKNNNECVLPQEC
ncbi:hypothetical protein FF38_07678 [Lucilia cuprina]|uniref:TIL domain-containing protein n=1 Tax=Lucilia cuprina TaxID=7375 RepID=A0A0L0CJY3_LUCCU|nr:Chymotrypsin inhibitor [Lucilia cuprina]KNC31784.1 hypothetical protein FF38_07678 [Lucilia cuprina]